MPLPVSVSPPTVQNDIDIIWPLLQPISVTQALVTNANVRYGGSTTALNLLSGSAVTAGGTSNMGSMVLSVGGTGQLVCGQVISDGAGGKYASFLGGFPCFVPLGPLAWASTFRFPSQMRLWRLQWIMRTSAAVNITGFTGIGFVPMTGAMGGLWGTAPLFGVGGDGAGNWNWQSRAVAGAAFTETVALGITCITPTLFDLVILAATGAAYAKVQLYVNGALTVTRSWGPATVLPDYTAVANATAMIPTIEAQDAIAATLQFAAIRCMAGHYQVDGSEVT